MGQKPNPGTLSDDELRRRLSEFVGHSRHVEADLVAHIAEFDARRLYAREASPSMFAWCTEVLHLSEHEAYLRIAAARASREHPVLLAMLRDGRLHLTAICKLAPHLTPGNREGLLRQAEHRSKRQIEELVASLAPRPAAPAVVRQLPDRFFSHLRRFAPTFPGTRRTVPMRRRCSRLTGTKLFDLFQSSQSASRLWRLCTASVQVGWPSGQLASTASEALCASRG